MFKRVALVIMTLIIGISMTACSSDGKKYMDVKTAQKAVLELTSGKISIVSQFEGGNKADTVKSEFVFKQSQNGALSYCHTKYDLDNKPVYCEYSDGEKSEQWLIGNGWSVIDTMQYTKDNPHRYMQFLSNTFDDKVLNSIKCDTTDTDKRYTIALDSKQLNKTTYKDADIEIISQSVSVLLNAKNELTCYSDTAKVLDKATKSENLYMLEMALSEQNAVNEIVRPDLRDYPSMK